MMKVIIYFISDHKVNASKYTPAHPQCINIDIVFSINDRVFAAKDGGCRMRSDPAASSVTIELPEDVEVSNDFKISFCRGNKAGVVLLLSTYTRVSIYIR